MSKADCRKFVPNIFNKSKCATCFKAKDEHSEEALENNRVILSISSYFLCKFVWWSGGSHQLNRDASQSVSRPTFFYKEKCISFCWLEYGGSIIGDRETQSSSDDKIPIHLPINSKATDGVMFYYADWFVNIWGQQVTDFYCSWSWREKYHPNWIQKLCGMPRIRKKIRRIRLVLLHHNKSV
jgi:hypothetical protein